MLMSTTVGFGHAVRGSLQAIVATLLLAGLAACGSDGGGGGGTPPPAEVRYAVTVTTTGNGAIASADGSISCGTQCTANLRVGTSLALTATPAAGFVLESWGGACAGTNGATCTITVNQATSLSATFRQSAQPGPALSVTVTGNGSVVSTPAGISCGTVCTASFAANTSVTLVATPAAAQRFRGWSGACSGTGTSCTVTLTAATSVGAAFEALPIIAWGDVTRVADTLVRDLRVAIDAAGNATAVWTQVHGATTSIMASRLVTGGSWSTPLEIDGTTTESVQDVELAADPATGRIMAIWVAQGGFALFGSAFAPETGWGAAQLILRRPTLQGSGIRSHRVALDGVGEAVAVWDMRDDSNLISVYASRYSLGGGWSAPVTIESNSGASTTIDEGPVVAMLTNGRAVAVWRSAAANRSGYWTNTFSGSTGWGSASELVRDEARTRVRFQELKADGQGNAVLAWSEFETNASQQTEHKMYVKRLTAGSWENAKTPVGTGIVITNGVASPARLAVSSSGRAALGWTLQDEAFRVSTAGGGAAWGTAFEVKQASTSVQVLQTAVAADGQGNVFAAWLQQVPSQSSPELWISRYAGSNWSAPTRHHSLPGTSGPMALAMNDRGDAVIVWGQNPTDPLQPSTLNSRAYRVGS
jgi:hypothetical protein